MPFDPDPHFLEAGTPFPRWHASERSRASPWPWPPSRTFSALPPCPRDHPPACLARPGCGSQILARSAPRDGRSLPRSGPLTGPFLPAEGPFPPAEGPFLPAPLLGVQPLWCGAVGHYSVDVPAGTRDRDGSRRSSSPSSGSGSQTLSTPKRILKGVGKRESILGVLGVLGFIHSLLSPLLRGLVACRSRWC